jgi:hypothetical protein
MTVLDRWFDEVWNKGNLSAVDELLATDVVIHNTLNGDGEKIWDRESFKRVFSTLRSELSEVSVTPDIQLQNGNLEAAHCSISAIYNDVRISPHKRRPIHFTGTSLIRVSDGRIEESWNHFDFETMYRQME